MAASFPTASPLFLLLGGMAKNRMIATPFTLAQMATKVHVFTTAKTQVNAPVGEEKIVWEGKFWAESYVPVNCVINAK